MARTAVGGDDDRPKKKFSDKITNSPAAKDYREKGTRYVAKKLGGHFVHSYSSSRGDVHGECASCQINEFNR